MNHILYFDVGNPGFHSFVRAVAERGVASFTSDPSLAEATRGSHFPCHFWGEGQSHDLGEKIETGAKSVLSRLDRLLQTPARDRAFRHCGEERFLKERGQTFVQKIAEMIVGQIDVIERFEDLIARQPLDFCVLGGDNSHRQRALIAVARKHGVKTLNLSHATYAQTVQARYTANQLEVYADSVAAYGERSREDMIALGYPREKIHVVGAPMWDELYQWRKRESASEFRRKNCRSPEKKQVLFCGCYAEGASAFYDILTRRSIAIHESLASSAQTLDEDVSFVFRPHPIEVSRALMSEEQRRAQIRAYKDWLTSIGFVDPEVSTGDFYEDVLSSDVVISTNGSSVIPVAMILNRPILAYRWSTEESKTYTEEDGVHLFDRDQDLGPILKQRLENGRSGAGFQALAEAALPAINFGHDGQASTRLADLIVALAKGASADSQRSTLSV